MTEKLRCIALRTIKYNDSTSIVTLWTDKLGRLSAAVPAGNSPQSRRCRALLLPLGVFDAVANIKAGREIARLSDMRPICQSPGASANPAKSVVAMFVSDFLYAVLKDSTPDSLATQFLLDSIAMLNAAHGTALANAHLYILYHLSHFLGIEPDVATYHQGSLFDMKEGRFTKTAPLHRSYLEAPAAKMVTVLSRMTVANIGRIKLSRVVRNEMLDRILEYYTLHYVSMTNLPSLPIVREIFR